MYLFCVRCGTRGAHVYNVSEGPMCEKCHGNELARKIIHEREEEEHARYTAGTQRNPGGGPER